MTDQNTRWDPSLLRKFSSTGHFRLLNQLKGDLKKKPLVRDQRSGELRVLSSGRNGAYRRSTSSRNPAPSPVVVAEVTKPNLDPTEQNPTDQPTSFRDRLNAIEMR
ncbi:MAG: hypothetical protein CMN95_06425 [Synechococcus sp. MED650]|nr:hypothetical protein [Synechococcus sp. MED650]OUW54348.1 MAG: hypothetical protein CBD48_05040 [Cyanobacteria bacterium TMED188]